jgi:hypothetical protein
MKKEEQKSYKSSRPREPERESQGWTEAETGHFPGAEVPRKARGLKDRVRRIFVQARVAKGQKVQLSLEKISTMWSFDAQVIVP